ncbi:MAG: DUF4827 domain-containing protein [Bacteroides sp.]|nr:DUF4827 domain-containing protein [Bacteroides sp.]
MKNLFLPFLLAAVVLGGIFQSCDNTKTYAERMADERKAINKYIKDQNIKVLTVEEFEKDTVTAENEYVLFPNTGVYMNIVSRGTNLSAKNGDILIARFLEHNLISGDTLSNIKAASPDVFTYRLSGNSAYGQVKYNSGGLLASYYEVATVPAGWLVALPYVGDSAHVKLIVPHKYGHDAAMEYVYPYAYDMRRITIYK